MIDGTGAPAQEMDVALQDGLVAAGGPKLGAGREEIAARGQLVTPGFVDIHTHFDGQVTWDPFLSPSTGHGVTTVVMGNCGVGFAPCAPERHEWLIQLMEGVEDIPGTALVEGIQWRWESFPEYLDAVDRSPLAIDVGLQIPHGALRGYVKQTDTKTKTKGKAQKKNNLRKKETNKQTNKQTNKERKKEERRKKER